MKALDLNGKGFNRLTVINRDENNRFGQSMWLCECHCGVKKTIKGSYLVSGHTRSCGCHQRDVIGSISRAHGMYGSPEHVSWNRMHQRCTNKKNNRFDNYGGRGITVCNRWQKSENFYADMGDKPTPKHSIDRIDNDGNYEPANCQWATPLEQAHNQRLQKGNKFGVSGVSKVGPRWLARIGHQNKVITLGTFDTLAEATDARKAAERFYW